ncbi:WD40 repeat domain-containing protein [Deinococcus frigens]|uniref:WD40 repeat domain-containing protein n=1 Tax=Deinococcus frigens TaxID=249403 RepID=UPI0012EC12AD|nr:WD40 repeat domain-containing protein [Deinococcus frigens]
MLRVSCLLAFICLSSAGAQRLSALDFGRSLKLPEGSYEAATTSRLLNRPLPRDGIRLTSLSVINAEFLKRVFTDAPSDFGFRCSGEREVVALPGTPNDGRAFVQTLLKQSGIQPLYQNPSRLYFSAGPTFAGFNEYQGALYLSVCQATRDLSGLVERVTPHETYLGQTPYLIAADYAGRLNWCTALPDPLLRSVRAFSGSALQADVSPDGSRIAVAGWDARPAVKVFDAATGALLQTLGLPSGPVSLTFSGDGKTLLVLDANTTYTWLDIASGQTLNSWQVVSLISSDLRGAGSSLFLEWSPTSTIRVYDAARATPRFSLRNFKLNARAVTPDGQWIVTASTRGVLSAFSTRDGKAGATVSLGVTTGAGLASGPGDSEVTALVIQTAEGRPPQVVTQIWAVGSPALRPAATINHRRADMIVFDSARTTPVSIPLCRAP